MSQTITGLCKSRRAAANAVQFLQQHGVSSSDISLVAREDFNEDGHDGVEPESHSRAPEGFAVGAAGGGAVGGLLAGLTAAQAIATGGAGLGLVVAGPLIATLVGAGAGASAGSIVGGMVGAAIPEKDANEYETAIKAGSVLIGVRIESTERKGPVKALLQEAGAEKIASG